LISDTGAGDDTRIFLDLEECKVLFRSLKINEKNLSGSERGLLRKVERFLYTRLSIQEIEELS
jgi:hypothetical protein